MNGNVPPGRVINGMTVHRTQGVGFSGIAGITWADGPMMMKGRSKDGRQ
jgi:hypothetical protein